MGKSTQKILSLLFFGSLSISTFGQFGPEQLINQCDVCWPTDIHVADLNGDGYQDILVASFTNAKLAWYANDGTGTFGARRLITDNLERAVFLKTADLDGDGDLDVVAAGELDEVICYENDGSGNFIESSSLPTVDFQPKAIYLADLDGFGSDDLIIAGLHEIRTLRNFGKGIYTYERSYSTADWINTVSASDLDGDGDNDILLATSNPPNLPQPGKILWFENGPNGNTLSIIHKLEIPQLTSAHSAFAEDVDEDGDLDIIANYSFPGDGRLMHRIVWLENTGGGAFAAETVIDTVPRLIYPGDVDLDGDIDLIASQWTTNTITRYTNLGEGSFSSPQVVTEQALSSSELHLADMDGDSRPDIIYAGFQHDRLAWYRNSETTPFPETVLAENAVTPRITQAVDLDLDGDHDLVVALGNAIGWYPNEGNSTFTALRRLPHQFQEITSFYITDFDQDGHPDLLIADRRSPELSWLRNTGNATSFERKRISNQITASASVVAADVDVDGDLDVLATTSGNTISWFVNAGDGETFTHYIVDDNFFSSTSASVADINQDGLPDIVAGSEGAQGIRWYQNKGDGTFSAGITVISQGNWVVSCADLDGDDDIDIISERANYWFRNDGDGKFSAQKLPDIPKSWGVPTDIYTADIDGDADLDLLVSSFFHLLWLQNLGAGNFQVNDIAGGQYRTSHVFASDLDQDADLDLIMTATGEEKIAIFENLLDYPNLTGTVFRDENADGIYNVEEPVLTNIPISIRPDALFTYTDQNGQFRFYLANGTYTVSIEPKEECWELSTDSLSYTININDNVALDRDFGVRPVSDYQHTRARIQSGPTRCGFEVPFWLSVENDGCRESSGKFGVVLDSLVEFVSAEVLPDEIRGDTLLWDHAPLFESQKERIDLVLQIAGVEFIDSVIQLTALSYIEAADGTLLLSDTYSFQSEIRCAYDPNDKLVTPARARSYGRNYTLFDEDLEYTIRFQNTGNDTAFTIIIRDFLDEQLDWNSFQPVLASHAYEALLHADGLVEFTFRNILLPDSTTNERLSHGFVTYRISPKAGLSENTEIQNKADILFDFNPPIVTNIVSSFLVSDLDNITSSSSTAELTEVRIYPNPSDGRLIFEWISLRPQSQCTLRIFDSTGKLVLLESLIQPKQSINIEELAGGLYLFQITDRHAGFRATGKIIKK